MPRFLLGLVLGSLASDIAYTITADGALAALAGISVAALIWFGLFLLDELR